ncbi:hypothetical protein [Streptomyces phaeochromogenes]|uniref:hypothetical protein n=1 Tax=Streptomyces phaeochromogenes TaxID=1923 RepID=UPI002E15E7E8|nr:hypothetical protein OG437_00230 [Streptomyces phaeochromogenes]
MDRPLAGNLRDPAVGKTAAGTFVRINDYRSDRGVQEQPLIVTTRDGEPVTAFGGRISREDMDIQ